MNKAPQAYSSLTVKPKATSLFDAAYCSNLFHFKNQFFTKTNFLNMKTKTNMQVWLMSLALVCFCAFASHAQELNSSQTPTVVLTPDGAKPFAPVKKDGSSLNSTTQQPQSLTQELSVTRQQAGFPTAYSDQIKKDLGRGLQNTDALMYAFMSQFKLWTSQTENWESYMSRDEMDILNRDGLASLWKYNFYKGMRLNEASH